MKVAKKHGPTLFVRVWPRQFLVAFVVALPAAYVARKLATAAVAKLTE